VSPNSRISHAVAMPEWLSSAIAAGISIRISHQCAQQWAGQSGSAAMSGGPGVNVPHAWPTLHCSQWLPKGSDRRWAIRGTYPASTGILERDGSDMSSPHDRNSHALMSSACGRMLCAVRSVIRRGESRLRRLEGHAVVRCGIAAQRVNEAKGLRGLTGGIWHVM
jgi:hypothetical protein